LLARRAYTERELLDRLARRGVAPADAAAAVGELRRRGLVDDGATAAMWARSWRDYKGWGPLRIRAELSRRGIGRPVADALLEELFGGDGAQSVAAREAARLIRRPAFRRAGRHRARWLTAQLLRRGFPHAVVRRVVLSCGLPAYGDGDDQGEMSISP
jgi:regulatory protein